MSSDPEAFESLRRLLALKRHEQPPPGYFDRFPGEVIARIRQAESEAAVGVPEPRVPWLQWAWNTLQARAMFPTCFAAAVCCVLVLGLARASGTPALAVSLLGPLPDSASAADHRPVTMPLAQRAAFHSSTTGVLPDQPPVGIFRPMHRSQNAGNNSSPSALPPAFD